MMLISSKTLLLENPSSSEAMEFDVLPGFV